MTTRRADGTLLGYSSRIAHAIGADDDALLDLVEDFMRIDRGTLDALSVPEFDRLARSAMSDVLAWHIAGEINGTTLPRYCETMGLLYPTVLDAPGAVFGVEV